MRMLRLVLLSIAIMSKPIFGFGGEILGSPSSEASQAQFSLMAEDPAGAEFSLRRSFFSWSWRLPENLQIDFGVGTSDLTQALVWYPENTRGLGLESFFLQAQTDLGWWSAGWLKVPFGAEGYFRENQWMMPESLMWKYRIWTARDMGLRYQTRSGNFFSTLMAHNGEGDPSLDDRGFYTGQIGSIDSQGSGVIVSLQTGSAEPIATASSSLPIGTWSFDLSQKLKIRQGALSLISRSARHFWLIEALRAEVLQLEEKFPYSSLRLDIHHFLSDKLSALLRGEELDFNSKVSKDSLKLIGAGFAYSSSRKQSQVGVYLTETINESTNKRHRAAEVFWRLGNETGN